MVEVATVKSFRKTSTAEKVSIARTLEAVLKSNGDGTFSYIEGWNDNRVGETCIPDYPGNKITAVSHVRMECHGELKKVAPATLEERFDKLQSEFVAMRERFDKVFG